MKQAAKVLRDVRLFSELGDEALAAVADRTVIRTLTANSILFRRDEPCQGFYVVIEGCVRVYRASRDGREQVIHTQGPGQPLAEVPLFDGGPYPASARALVDSRLLFLPLGEFQWLYRNHPEIADAVIHELGRRLRKMVALVEKISLKDVSARVAASLLEFAGSSADVHDGIQFTLPRTQEELAAELATTRESVARALSRLRAGKVIDQNGRQVTIRSVAKLEGISAGG